MKTVEGKVMKKKESRTRKRKNETKKGVVLGPAYDWWFNEKDDIYDKLYKDKV